MPYSGPNDETLPVYIAGKPVSVRGHWVSEWNAADANCRRNGTGGPDCEGYAFRVANAAIKEVGGVTECKTVNDDKAAHGNEGLMRRAMRAMQSAMGAMRSMMGDDGEHDGAASQVAARAVTTAKDSKGTWRWLAVVSNQFRDRDGEIITEKAHQDFVRAVAEEEIPHPELWLWHTPGTKVGQSDLVAYSDGFLLASGTFDDAATAERLSTMEAELGVSHGFRKQQTGSDITAYRTFEVSLLPHEWAANPWTAVDFSNKEKDMALTDEQRAFLAQALGEEKAKEIEATLPAAADKIKAIQEILAVVPDGLFGRRSRAALAELLRMVGQPGI